MTIAEIIPAVSFCLLPVIFIVCFVRSRSLRKKMGARELVMPQKYRLQFLGVLCSAPILIGLTYIRKFDALSVTAICGVGVLGFFIAIQDILYSGISGVYENGLIWNSSYLFFNDIDEVSLPEEATLVLLTKDRTRKVFSSNDTALLTNVKEVIEKKLNSLQ
ncbi:hypothetical protein K7I13_06645 [Brucepastera parasyntrophica]|uniref:hypothetical protein n=1 Tax=Brucepastera parasyntrophica TaxID=2880008 RepID=UPI0021086E84|nr:hypothetical protein [Brucepastera parasyntrophica]ULQ60930.1 hypothetical protein K7I13_06645 [Brucepastera parasyntrophica]